MGGEVLSKRLSEDLRDSVSPRGIHSKMRWKSLRRLQDDHSQPLGGKGGCGRRREAPRNLVSRSGCNLCGMG